MSNRVFDISQKLLVKEFESLQDYQTIYNQMINFTQNREQSTLDELWILQHNPVFTQGNTGKEEHILAKSEIPIIQVDRGGQITYHGPNQIVLYALIDIQRKRLNGFLDFTHRTLISAFENSIIQLCNEYNLESYEKPDAPGIYIMVNNIEKKLCSVGVKINRKGSYHGLALNIDADLTPFQQINPCGYAGLEMINLQNLVTQKLNLKTIINSLVNSLTFSLQYLDVQHQTI